MAPRTPDPIRRLRLVFLLLISMLLVGTAGYMSIEDMTPLDALYMTVITLGTVGYRELKELSPAGKVFTMGVIVFGVGTGAWALQIVVEAVVGEQLTRRMWRRRMDKRIAQLKEHYIICGHGRMGQQITRELARRKLPFVVIESNPEQMPLLEQLGYAFVVGNASSDHVLAQAGIERAKGLVTVAPTDADNTFITLSARGLNPKIYIVARSVILEDEEKLRRAGADRVLSPYVTGGRRMAVALLRPTVADFLDVAMHSESLELELEEVVIADASALVGRSVTDVGLHCPSGPTIVGVKSRQGKMQIGTRCTRMLEPGDTLVTIGTEEQIDELRAAAKG